MWVGAVVEDEEHISPTLLECHEVPQFLCALIITSQGLLQFTARKAVALPPQCPKV